MQERTFSGNHHHCCTAHNKFSVYKTKKTGVRTIIPIIPHHEIFSVRYIHCPK